MRAMIMRMMMVMNIEDVDKAIAAGNDKTLPGV